MVDTKQMTEQEREASIDQFYGHNGDVDLVVRQLQNRLFSIKHMIADLNEIEGVTASLEGLTINITIDGSE